MDFELETVSEDQLTDQEKGLIAEFQEKLGEDADDTPIVITQADTDLTRVRVAEFQLRIAQNNLDEAVATAKEHHTWQEIGDILGTSRQSARERFLTKGARRRPRGESTFEVSACTCQKHNEKESV